MTMTGSRMRPAILIGIALVLGVVVAWRFTTGGDSVDADETTARIDKLERAGDVRELAREVAKADVRVARRAVLALGRVGREAVREIEQALKDTRPKVREAASVALGRAGDEDEAPALAAVATGDESSSVRASAVQALGRMRAYTEMETLLQALNDEDIAVRRRANTAIVKVVGAGVGFQASDPPAKRAQAIRELRAMWMKMKAKTEEFYKARRSRRKGR